MLDNCCFYSYRKYLQILLSDGGESKLRQLHVLSGRMTPEYTIHWKTNSVILSERIGTHFLLGHSQEWEGKGLIQAKHRHT
jgi:hypothetical protein